MQVIWKDSKLYEKGKRCQDTNGYKTYRIHKESNGWVVNIPGDDNIYARYDHACNVVNDYLGHKRVGRGRFEGYKIKIIGKRTEQTKKEEGLSI